jgi:AcrR family transcriptional regulator
MRNVNMIESSDALIPPHIESDGRRALTTNRIAERAGVSIGTLYRYFANKEAILIEMARAQLESDRIAITRALSKSISGAPAKPERLAMLRLRDGLSTYFQTEGRASAF